MGWVRTYKPQVIHFLGIAMTRRFIAPLLVMSSLSLAACGQKTDAPAPPSPRPSQALKQSPSEGRAQDAAAPRMLAAAPAAVRQMNETSRADDAPAASGRFLAVRHQISLQSEAEQLRAIYDQILQSCALPQCEVLNASFAIETENNLPSASMELRMEPSKSEAFIARLSGMAQLIGHQRSADDRTDQVVDTEARLKNLNDLRERLRALLNERKGSLKELLDVQRELAETQAKLDAAASMRKLLANETEKVAFGITLQAKRLPLNRQLWQPLQEAWGSSGHTLVASLAWMLSALVSLLPWIILVGAGLWGWLTWRRGRAARG
jgi:predicted small lipoprotein YifL